MEGVIKEVRASSPNGNSMSPVKSLRRGHENLKSPKGWEAS